MIRIHRRLSLVMAAMLIAVVGCEDGTVVDDPNTSPTAAISTSSSVLVGSEVVLDGGNSSDPDGDNLSHAWELLATPTGSDAALTGADSDMASFTADATGTYEVQLVVSDGAEADTASAQVMATNSTPTAVALPEDTLVGAGATIDLDGSGSMDADGQTLSYSWTLDAPEGSDAAVTDPDNMSPSFTTDVVGEYRATLTVSDGYTQSTDVAVIEAVEPGDPPSIVSVGTEGHIAADVPHEVFVEATDAESTELLYTWSLIEGDGELYFPDTLFNTDTTEIAITGFGSFLVEVAVSDGLNVVADTLEFEVHDAVLDSDVTTDETFYPLLNADYTVTREVNIEAAATAMPGTVFRFQSGAAFDVQGNGGSLKAVGTEADTIRFVGDVEESGFWRGIRVGTNNTANELAFVEVAHAGSDDFGTTNIRSNVHVDAPGRLSVSDSWIHQSADIGLAADNGVTLSFSGNRFGGNVGEGVRVGAQVVGMLDAATVYDDPADPNGDAWIGVWDADVQQDATWPAAGAPYLFEDETNILAAVTIDAGAEFWFTAGAGLDVTSGTLTAIGTEGAPIVFRGQTAVQGHWRGIRFQSNDPLNELTHVQVSHGGENDFGTTNVRANVHLDAPAQVAITSSSFTSSSVYGVYADNSANLRAFESNHFSGNGDAGLVVGAELVGSLDTLTVYNDGDDPNGEDYIRVLAADVQQDATWPATHSPYGFENETNIEAAITVEPGAVFWFQFGAGLDVTSGSLSAIGTETDTIKFLGTTQTAGHWRGIRFQTNDPVNELTYVEIAHGGEDDFGTTNIHSNVHVDGSARIEITNSTFRGSSNVGLYLESGNNIDAFSGNRFGGNGAAGLKAAANQVAELDAATVYDDPANPNGDGYIDVYGVDVTTAGSWPAPSTPYRFTGETNVEAAITIDAGAELWFGAGAGLDVTGSSGSLAAIGTSADRITFRGQIETVGYWRGIRFQTNDPANELKYVNVYHGGEGDFGTTNVLANVHVDAPGSLTLSFSTFDMSADWDVYKDASATIDDSGGNNQYNSGGTNF